MATYTPVVKPTVGGSTDTWGAENNAALGHLESDRDDLDRRTTTLEGTVISGGSSGSPSTGFANVKNLGVYGDGQAYKAASITFGSSTLTTTAGVFTSADVGKTILVYGAAGSGSYTALKTTISGYTSATSVTLAATAGSTASNVWIVWGARDETTAFQTILNNAHGRVYAPAGVYLVSSLTLPDGVELVGEAAMAYTGLPVAGTILVCNNPAQTTAVLVYSGRNTVTDLAVIGSSSNHECVKPATTSSHFNNFTRLTLARGKVGFHANYTSVNTVTDCQIHENNIGMRDLVDSLVVGGYINANSGDAIYLGSGANDNVFNDIKLEFNSGFGFQTFAGNHNVVALCNIDRNGQAGIRVGYATQTTITGCILRRNGGNSSGSGTDDTHFYFEGATDVLVTGCTTNKGANDDGSGYNSPTHSVIRSNNTNLLISNSSLSGCNGTADQNNGTTGVNEQFWMCSGLTGIQTVGNSRVAVGIGAQTTAAASTGTAAWTFTLPTLGTFYLGDQYTLDLTGRDTVSGNRYAATVPVLVTREGGNATVTLGTVTNTFGTTFGTTGTTLTVTATVATDGSTVTVTVTNSGANSRVLAARLR